jgi:hypothetical protein
MAMALDDRARHRGRNPRLEMAITVLVIAILVGTVIVFLFVYHDVPLRTS